MQHLHFVNYSMQKLQKEDNPRVQKGVAGRGIRITFYVMQNYQQFLKVIDGRIQYL